MGAKNSKEKKEKEGKKEETQIPPDKTISVVERPKSTSSVSNVSTLRALTRHDRSSASTSRDYAKVPEAVQVGHKTVFHNKKRDKIVVMAIDFGTTYTGYAYSFCDDPQQIYTNYWDGSQIKEPTVVLLDDKRNFHSFGNEAKKNYTELIKKGLHRKWYYFEHFKMKLFVQEGPLDVGLELVDMTDKKMKAIEIFAAVIKYMKEHFLEKLHGDHKVKLLKVEDVHFILTVPAIWSDLSKRFMRQAATQAGIPDEALSLALEPEAASLYCKENLKEVQIIPGTRYIVADLGGGTADFTCHEINPDNTLKELQKPSGGDYGGITVDHAFRKLLNAIFGADILEMFKENNMEEFYDLLTRFEVKKRNFHGRDKMILQFPVSLLEKYEEEVGMTVESTLRSSPYRGRVEFKQDKMVIQLELAQELFNEAVSKIVEKTTDLLKEGDGLQALVLVGGFSESKYLRNTMMEKFQHKIRVLWPEEPASAVIKGAVINGQQPKAIDSRVCKYTYGIGRMMIFKPYHPSHKRVDIDGVAWCDDLFNKHIEIGQTVRLDDDFPEAEYFPLTDKMKQAVLMVYASSKKYPMFIDEEGCQLIGLISVELTGGDVNAKVLVKLVFGGTELRVEAVEEQTGKTTIGHIDFLG